MPKTEIVSLRFTADEKVCLLESARSQNDSVTDFIKKRLAPDIRIGPKKNPRLPTEAERRVLKRFVGAVRSGKKHRLSNEEIDRIVYGK